jgi:hypothetical protein
MTAYDSYLRARELHSLQQPVTETEGLGVLETLKLSRRGCRRR